jgi:hypothetical protein
MIIFIIFMRVLVLWLDGIRLTVAYVDFVVWQGRIGGLFVLGRIMVGNVRFGDIKSLN